MVSIEHYDGFGVSMEHPDGFTWLDSNNTMVSWVSIEQQIVSDGSTQMVSGDFSQTHIWSQVV